VFYLLLKVLCNKRAAYTPMTYGYSFYLCAKTRIMSNEGITLQQSRGLFKRFTHAVSNALRGETDKDDTEGGLTRQQRAVVADWEYRHRGAATEVAVVIDKNGRIIGGGGDGDKKHVRIKGVRKDSVVIHNHPYQDDVYGFRGGYIPNDKTGLAGKIGHSFSPQDVKSAIERDVAEIRVNTPTYTFSLRRPKKGWGVDADTAAKRIAELQKSNRYGRTRAGGYDTEKEALEAMNRMEREFVVYTHRGIADAAKEFGWTYKRRRVKNS